MRIAIINDDPMAVKLLEYSVLTVDDHQIAWVAENGVQAVNFALKDLPDLILMDIYMPELDGVETTRKIMKQSPCAILIVTSSVNDHSGKVFDAMGAGALDAVNTPVLIGNTDTNGVDALLRKIDTISLLIDPNTKLRRNKASNKKIAEQIQKKKNLIVIGASTGGPKALATLLSEFPPDFSTPIVVVQHVDSQFVSGLVEWLDKQINLSVVVAKHDDQVKPGNVYLAGSDQHLVINKFGVLQYQNEPKDYIHKPSVTVLFESVAEQWNGQAIGVLLTGMGKDGAAGLLEMRERGFYTIAQDEESCAVYGMPKYAVQLNAVEIILPLNKIASTISKYCSVDHISQALIND
jgi:two-component system response regulator WspF